MCIRLLHCISMTTIYDNPFNRRCSQSSIWCKHLVKKKNKMYSDEFYIVILSEAHMVECCETHEKWNETRNGEMNKTTNEQQQHHQTQRIQYTYKTATAIASIQSKLITEWRWLKWWAPFNVHHVQLFSLSFNENQKH